MAIFLDTGFYMGLVDPSDSAYTRSNELLKQLIHGDYGQIYTSEFIMVEASTLAALRTKNHPIALNRMFSLFFGETEIASLLPITESIIEQTWILFLKRNSISEKKTISFVDCSNVVLCLSRNISQILAYDSHFDGWITRIY